MPKRTQLASLRTQNKLLREQLEQITLAAGELSGSQLNYLTQTQTEKPASSSLSSVVERCRYWANESSFIAQQWLPLKLSVCNYEMRLKPAETKKGGKQQASLDKWLAEDAPMAVTEYTNATTGQTIEIESTSSRAELIEKFVKAAWKDRLLFDNVVALWTDDGQLPVTLALERCIYTDTLGVEVLSYTHGLSRSQIEVLPDDQQAVFSSGATISINPKDGFHFKVFKDAAVGQGFALPKLYSIFRLLGEVESKEFGYNAMAFAFRSVKRTHLLGHEIKNGPNAGKPFHFWNKTRDTSTRAKWKDVVGFEDFTANFDYKVVYPWPDPKLFDEVVWKGSDRRLYQWGGPVMQMLTAKGVTPYLPNLLRASVGAERREFGRYLSAIINRAFKPPVPVVVTWSDAIFNESRLAAELIKFGVQQGYLSATTGTEAAGLNREEEALRKLAEADDPDARKTLLPVWDASHGTAPALDGTEAPGADAKPKGANPGNRSGRKPGTPDSK